MQYLKKFEEYNYTMDVETEPEVKPKDPKTTPDKSPKGPIPHKRPGVVPKPMALKKGNIEDVIEKFAKLTYQKY